MPETADLTLGERVARFSEAALAYPGEHPFLAFIFVASGMLLIALAGLQLGQQIPARYTVRSLRTRWVTSVMTVLGAALVVWASVLSFGLAAGLDHTLKVSGDPLDLIVMRKGSSAEIGSIIDEAAVNRLRETERNALFADEQGTPYCSAEIVVVVNTPRRNDGGKANLVLRGLDRNGTGFAMRPGFQLLEGRLPNDGTKEAMASRSIADRFVGAGLGETMDVFDEDSHFKIVGIFAAGDSAAESEIWTYAGDLADAAKRPGVVSSVQLRAESPAALKGLQARLAADEEFSLEAKREVDYFADQAIASVAIKTVGLLISVLLVFGASFAVANTMFGAVASRAREIGTLRALGFSRANVLTSFLVESLVLCIAGAAIGCLATAPLRGFGTGTMNAATFSEITFGFRFGLEQLFAGGALAVLMGVMGGFLPAWRATRMNIIGALRDA
jgi:putative ABC transport system permease protein